MNIEAIADVLVVASAFLAAMFVILYHVLTPWWKTSVGRNLQVFMALTAILLIMSTVRIFGDASLDAGWFAWMRLSILAGFPLAIGQRIWLLLRFQIRERGKQ